MNAFSQKKKKKEGIGWFYSAKFFKKKVRAIGERLMFSDA